MTGEDSPRPSGRGKYPAPGNTEAWTAIAANPRSTPDDLMHCLAHELAESVRLAAVSNPAHDGVAARMASGDPSPVVRAAVMLSPWIDEETRTALMDDQDVVDAAARMTGEEDELPALAPRSSLT